MTTANTVQTYLHALNVPGLVTEDDKTVTITGKHGDKTFDLKLDKFNEDGSEAAYSMQDVYQMVLREYARIQPVVEDDGKVADDPEKDKLRAKSIPQPGAEVSEDGTQSFPTEKNEETHGTPAQGV